MQLLALGALRKVIGRHKEYLMTGNIYAKRLGLITDEQLQAALDRFHLGRFLGAEPVPFGVFGQNLFVSSTAGDFVLRGNPLFWWQFPTEQFYARFLHERAHAPAPWPYRIDPTTDIFGWSYVLMPRMPGLQLADPQVREQLLPSERHAIATTLGENLAHLQRATGPRAGCYQPTTDTVEPFELAQELAWPLPVESDPDLAVLTPRSISYSERVQACLRHHLAKARKLNAAATTRQDIAWVEDCLAEADDALDDRFEPCLVLQDYKRSNVTVQRQGAGWQVSGVFDLMEAHFGDGEADLSRLFAVYLEEDRQLARAFLQGYLSQTIPRPGFAKRFPIYILLDRAMVWEFGQRVAGWWDGHRTFRNWVGPCTTLDDML